MDKPVPYNITVTNLMERTLSMTATTRPVPSTKNLMEMSVQIDIAEQYLGLTDPTFESEYMNLLWYGIIGSEQFEEDLQLLRKKYGIAYNE
jgi:hypothetical protein